VFQYRPAPIPGKYKKVPENITTSSRTILESPAGSNWNQVPDGKKIRIKKSREFCLVALDLEH
jgi:hypothetical protein